MKRTARVAMSRILQWAIAMVTHFSIRRAERSPTNALIRRVSVLASGKIFLEDREATMSEVVRALETVKAERGTVWFYRESGKGVPPPAAVEVFKFIVENKIPISLSSKADFSDYVDENGQSYPRN